MADPKEEPACIDPWVEQDFDAFREALLENIECPSIQQLVEQEAASEKANLTREWVQETLLSICTGIAQEL
jgi:hypothetical protein